MRSIPKDTTEAATLQKVFSIPALRRYVIPGELVECTDTYVFIMPQLRTLDTLGPGGPITLDVFLEQLATIMDVRSTLTVAPKIWGSCSHSTIGFAADAREPYRICGESHSMISLVLSNASW